MSNMFVLVILYMHICIYTRYVIYGIYTVRNKWYNIDYKMV